MNFKVNYENLHLSELKDALNKLNEDSQPEEAEYIRQLILKGGYQYPENTNYESAEISSTPFKWVLVSIITALLFFNIFTLIKSNYLWSVIPIIIQTALLSMIFTNNKNLKLLIKIWLIIIITGNFLGFYMLLIGSEPINYLQLADKGITLLVGIIIFWLSSKYIVMLPKASNKAIKKDV